VVEVKKKDSESSESLIRRFNRRVQQSGVLLRTKKAQYYTETPNERKVKDRAIRRSKIMEKKEYLRKIGKLDDLMAKTKGRGRTRGLVKLLGVKIKK
jgi:ribosomal protein S21